MTTLERTYRPFLVAYPRAYRESHGSEILTALFDASMPGQRLPDPREVAALLVGGLRMRGRLARSHRPRSIWGDACRLSALVLLANLFGASLGMMVAEPHVRARIEPVLLALTIGLLVRWPRRWLLLLLAIDALFAWPTGLPDPTLGLGLNLSWLTFGGWRSVLSGFFVWLLPFALAAAGLLLPSPRVRGGAWPWWLLAALLIVPPLLPWQMIPLLDLALNSVLSGPLVLVLAVPYGTVLLVLAVAGLTGNPRWTVAVIVFAGTLLGLAAANALVAGAGSATRLGAAVGAASSLLPTGATPYDVALPALLLTAAIAAHFAIAAQSGGGTSARRAPSR